MKQIEIKISGSGTRNQISTRLLEIARNIESLSDEDIENGKEWEDGCLFTEITE